MLSVIDAVIILFLLLGAVLGFKKGFIKSIVTLVGTILVIVLSFALKDSLALFLMNRLPFFDVGIESLNILIYQGIAFLLIFLVLTILLKIIIKISGIIENLLKFTIILSIPSKILGAILGFIEMYVFIFIILYALSIFNVNSTLIIESKLANSILSNTPLISSVLEDSYNATKELITLNVDSHLDSDTLNNKGIEILKKYNIISEEEIEDLVSQGKLSND